jgi:quinol monooxygenase YgiN
MSLRVVAHARAKPGKAAELQEVFEALVDPTRSEEGCLGYELLASLDDELEFTFVEEWTDRAALDSHLASSHVRAANGRLPGLLEGEVVIGIYRPVR